MVSDSQKKKTYLVVTDTAKKAAEKGLEYNEDKPKSQQVGLTKKEADEMGIASGIERANQLINNEVIPYSSAYKVVRFKRWTARDNKTPAIRAIINLWGGENYIKLAEKFIDSLDGKEFYLNGEKYDGSSHMMSNGVFHTGKTHTKSSKKLVLK